MFENCFTKAGGLVGSDMRSVITLVVCLLVGIGCGAVSALWQGGMIRGGPTIGNAVNVGGWQSDWSIGSKQANPYVRARVARHGLMGLSRDEAVYFIKNFDDRGERLTEACIYHVYGRAMPARWWSLTLYDSDAYLPRNRDRALSFDATKADGDWIFQISPTPPEDSEMAWVSSKNAGQFDLTLRLYTPTGDLLNKPREALRTPTIAHQSCAEAPP